MNRRERRSAARQARRAPDGSGAATPAALYRAGLVHIRAGRLVEAQVCCQKILAVEPDDADATFLIGLVSLEAGQSDHAVEWFSRAIGRQPKVEYVSSLGIALRRLGRLEEASKAFDASSRRPSRRNAIPSEDTYSTLGCRPMARLNHSTAWSLWPASSDTRLIRKVASASSGSTARIFWQQTCASTNRPARMWTRPARKSAGDVAAP